MDVQSDTLTHVSEDAKVSSVDFKGDSMNVKWIVDSGATRHMSNESQGIFQDFKHSEVGVCLGEQFKFSVCRGRLSWTNLGCS